jgi:hypothetical protein
MMTRTTAEYLSAELPQEEHDPKEQKHQHVRLHHLQPGAYLPPTVEGLLPVE